MLLRRYPSGSPRRRLRRRRGGFTLLELSVCVTLMGIMAAFTLPSFSRVAEQNRVDASAQYLRATWAAQRIYWLENQTFADSMTKLYSQGLIDPKLAGGDDGRFDYVLSNVTPSTFTVTATRHGSAVWSGSLAITQDGQVSGFLSGSTVLIPPGI